METDHQRRERLTVFRPESAPTVMAPGPGGALDMSPEASLSSHPGHDLSVDHIQGKRTKWKVAGVLTEKSQISTGEKINV